VDEKEKGDGETTITFNCPIKRLVAMAPLQRKSLLQGQETQLDWARGFNDNHQLVVLGYEDVGSKIESTVLYCQWCLQIAPLIMWMDLYKEAFSQVNPDSGPQVGGPTLLKDS